MFFFLFFSGDEQAGRFGTPSQRLGSCSNNGLGEGGCYSLFGVFGVGWGWVVFFGGGGVVDCLGCSGWVDWWGWVVSFGAGVIVGAGGGELPLF